MQALPFLTLGLGVYQTVSAHQQQERAIQMAQQAANTPRLTPQMQEQILGTANAKTKSNLASRGLSDSSLLPAGLAQNAKGVAEAAAAAGTQGSPMDVADMIYRQSLGIGQSGADLTGGIAQYYLMKRMQQQQQNQQSPYPYPVTPQYPSTPQPGLDPFQPFLM